MGEKTTAVIRLSYAEVTSPKEVLPAVGGTVDCLASALAVGGIVYALERLEFTFEGNLAIY